ncbi:thermonuclease family protein [bacterium]|nr:thermonuclease family protein [bacterium]
MYTYKAKVLRVVDGDTIDVQTDLGFEIFANFRFRLSEINAPETHRRSHDSEEYKAGIKTTEWLTAKIGGKEIIVKTEKDKKEAYGRYLAYIFVDGEEVSLNQQMLELGLAKKYVK